MPSLRRTLSSPSVRSSPYYPTSSSHPTRLGARSPRRSSGSDTLNRRVLADIDWWRVEESQHEVRGLALHEPLRDTTPSADEDELDQEEREPAPSQNTPPSPPTHHLGAAPTTLWHNVPGAGSDAFESVAPFHLDFTLGDSEPQTLESSSPVAQFAALSISSLGRSSFRRTSSASSTFSDASSDSSYSTPSFAPMGLSLGFSDFVSSPAFEDDDGPMPAPPMSALPRTPRRPSAAPARMGRSPSYSFVEDELSFMRERFDAFDDASPFSHSFADQDDPFYQ